MRQLILLIVFGIFLSATTAFAECTTIVSGIISGQTWTMENSPYCIDGDIEVMSLTIEPGVRVEFLDNYEFNVTGVINAVGNNSNPVVFTTEENNTSGWQGIYFYYSNTSSVLKYCNISNSINGGIRIIETILTIENCIIEGNDRVTGGGMYIEFSSADEFIIKDCSILGNTNNKAIITGDNEGGGIYANIGPNGHLLLSGCEIEGNISNSYRACQDCAVTGAGGGIYKTGAGLLTLEKCIVDNNQVWTKENHNGKSSPEANLYQNANSYGGGLFVNGGTLNASNSIFGYNACYAYSLYSTSNYSSYYNGRSYAYGGGIHRQSGTVTLTNCVVRNNSVEAVKANGEGYYVYTEGGGLSGDMTVINTILYYNTQINVGSVTYNQIYGSPTITYSNVHGGYPGEGNIIQNPAFIDPCHIGDFCQIDPISPCVDVGNNNGISEIGLPETDLAGKQRICFGREAHVVDMGVNEICGPLLLPEANAGPNQIICYEICSGVVLDGRNSHNPYGNIDSYYWELLYRDNSAHDATASGETPVLLDLEPGVYDVTLTIAVNGSETHTDEMTLTVIETCNGCNILKGDFDNDGDVDAADLEIFAGHFGTVQVLTP